MLTDRSMRGHSRRAVGLPQLGESRPHEGPHESLPAAPTQYRLPKLQTPPRRTAGASVAVAGPAAAAGVVYTRYGYCSSRSPCSSSSLELDRGDCPQTTRAVFRGPTFTQAVVTPVWSPLMAQQLGPAASDGAQGEISEPGMRFLSRRSKTSCPTLFSAFGSTVQLPRVLHEELPQLQTADTAGAFGTEEKPVHWVMRPLRRFQVDRKGQQRNQGPFSREFVVHARAPQSWLRMKWGRQPAA